MIFFYKTNMIFISKKFITLYRKILAKIFFKKWNLEYMK